eukprot:844698-Prorocentrum_minimum.AAC.1
MWCGCMGRRVFTSSDSKRWLPMTVRRPGFPRVGRDLNTSTRTVGGGRRDAQGDASSVGKGAGQGG